MPTRTSVPVIYISSSLRWIITSAIVFLIPIILSAQQWTPVDPLSIATVGKRDILPDKYLVYRIDPEAIREILWRAPEEDQTPLTGSEVLLTIGMPDGKDDIFHIVEYDMMEPGLKDEFDDYKTFRGISTSDPYRTIRIDWTANGLRAVVRDLQGQTFIDPYQRGDLQHRIAYFKKDISRKDKWVCEVDTRNPVDNPEVQRAGDCTFRSYRLAQAANGEYCNYFNATSSADVDIIMSEVITAVNRVNEVYEIDISVRLILVNNVDTLFFYNPSTDPYTNGNGSTMLGQNITTCNNRIGSANYDIGHVFSTGGGGVAYLNALCNNSLKAGGVTGQPNPVNDPFYIDYVAHEMGHQFGGNHTQNNACNRNSATAMEPGSASTIMGYAGICAPNVQSNSDAYFHGVNIQEIANHIASTNCHAVISTSNDPPIVSNLSNYSIPVSTPFVLTAVASDPDDDPLTYCWEQWDHEVGTMPPLSTNTLGPMFRSLTPVASPSRYFYNLTDLTNNINPQWEELPSIGRSMEFKVVVRDYYNNLYGCTDEDNTIVTTIAGIGPFTVTSQNSGATWVEGSEQTITWNVANTTASPVSCANVMISLSYDGGFTYPATLVASTPNDGSATVTIPPGTTSEGRVMVKATNNIFFDINNQDITIEAGLPNYTLSLNPSSVTECNDGSVQTTVNIGSFMGFSDPVTLTLLNKPPGSVVNFVPAIVVPGNTSTLTISNLGGLLGTFNPVVRGTSTTGSQDKIFSITLNDIAAAPMLDSPFDGAVNVDLRPTLAWETVSNATSYDYQIAVNSSFNPVLYAGTVTTNNILINTLLENATTYYWRVKSGSVCGPGDWSDAFEFKTMTCQNYMSVDVPKTIPTSGGNPVVESILNIPANDEILDINVISLTGTHTEIDDLEFTLIPPAGSMVLFWDNPCGDHDNFNIQFDDEAANMNWPCPPTNGLPYRPNNSFLPFTGLNSSGVWTLSIKDIQAQDGGTLNTWGLRVCKDASCDLLVTEISGSGSGTLLSALTCAGDGDTILLSSALSGQTINVGISPLLVTKDITILAESGSITVSSTGPRPFEIGSGAEVELNGVQIRAGLSMTGGAILNDGVLTLENVSVEKNNLVSGATLIHNTNGSLKLEGNCSIRQ